MSDPYKVLVCQSTSCLRQGSANVLQEFRTQAITQDHIQVSACECQGQCNMSTTVLVNEETWYCRITPEDVSTIVEQHFQQGQPVESLLHPRWHPRY